MITSSVGVATYALLSLVTTGPVRPEWAIGLACGFGGLIGGYVGARLQPYLPERLLRVFLGAVAAGLAALYVLQATGMLSR